MTGNQTDMSARIRAVLPNRWFPDQTPVLDGVLAGLGQAASWVYALVEYARLQTRIATAVDGWLDLIAQDCFGSRLVRSLGEGDGALRARIDLELLRPRATRPALIKQISDITGHQPWVFEPMRPADTGSWGGVLAYGGASTSGAGGWGSLQLPFQCFVVVQRSIQGGVPGITGYCSGAGGYGVGVINYADAATATGSAADVKIMAAIAEVMPACAIAWTRLAG